MSHRPAIGVDALWDDRHGRQMLLGILDYNRDHDLWTVERHKPTFLRRWAHSGHIVGAIAMVTAQADGVLDGLPVPLVNISSQQALHGVPSVLNDDHRIGRLAGGYFLEKGYEHLGYVGIPGHYYSLQREAGFREAVSGAGFEVQNLSPPMEASRRGPSEEEYASWLAKRLGELAYPLAVFVCNDLRARAVVRACEAAELHVPEQVAVLGVDDDEVVCRLVRPEVSSIRTDSQRIGYEAAKLLAGLLRGEPAPSGPLLIPPLEVVERRSSEAFAVHDALLAKVLRWIAQNTQQGLTVKDVLQEFRISRRALELRFREELGRTPLQEIRRMRLQRAMALLTQTSLPMPQVAGLSGFSDAKVFGMTFRREIGLTPTGYRRQHRSH